jgi:hypothetical protein
VLLLLLFLQPQDDIEAAIAKIRAGQAPEKIPKDKRVLDAIAAQVRDGKPCAEPVLLHLCEHGTREHAEAIVALLEHASVKVAYAAVFAAAPFVDEKLLPALEKRLDGRRDAQIRALLVIAESRFGPAGALLEKRLSLLDAADMERSKAMLRAIGACRLRAAHDAILAYYDQAGDDLAVRTLGRLWEMKLDAKPLAKAEEIRRLTALLLARRLALGGATNEAFCEAMLRIMTREEFEKFLADHAKEKFFSRRVLALAALKRGFDRAKGLKLAEAFFESPDPALVAQIIVTCPWDLPVGKLALALDDKNEPKIEEAPAHARVCDLAVWRLALQLDKQENEIPPEVEKRDALVKEWKRRLIK